MAISEDEVRAMARLARLAIEPDDVADYAEQLSGILALVAQMAEIDTTAVEPLAHPMDLVARLRPDRVSEGDQRELFQSLAPEVERGLYLVPKVIE